MQIKSLYHLIIITVIIGCGQSHSFEKVDCIESGTSYMVFKPCRQLIFQAKYWDKDQNLISDEKIWMMANGKPWISEPEKQNEIVIQYEYDNSKIELLEKYSLNPEIGNWSSMEVTGVIESKSRIWMHPFRQNQYNFTEVACFPEVRLPLEIGKTWTGNLHIYNWGVWSDSQVSRFYEVLNFETIQIAYDKIDAWHIQSLAEASFGNSTHNFWFHPNLGFVKMVIHNYAGQTLEIELIDVIEG
jgi:hypothetical protein